MKNIEELKAKIWEDNKVEVDDVNPLAAAVDVMLAKGIITQEEIDAEKVKIVETHNAKLQAKLDNMENDPEFQQIQELVGGLSGLLSKLCGCENCSDEEEETTEESAE